MESADLENALTAMAYASKNPPVMHTATEDTTQQVSSAGSAGRVEAGGEAYDAHVTSTHTANRPSYSRSTSPSEVDLESSRTSFESVGYGGEKHVHLSGNGIMVPNPSNTGNRVDLRAASLAISPSIDGSFGGPSVAFDTRRNVTVPIATKHQPLAPKPDHATDVREPTPANQLPNINETLGALAPPRQGDVPQPPAPVKYINVAPSAGPTAPRGQALPVNPYFRRADDIGPRHGVPGLGHIGALLTPPGWKPGDEPITDIEAEWLYDQSRALAAKSLNMVVSRRENTTSANYLQRNAEEVEQWQRQLKMDIICLQERKWIYARWREREAFRAMQAQQQRPVQGQARVVPSPIHPVTQTSIHAYQRHQQAQLPNSPLSPYPSNAPPTAGALRNRLQGLQQGVHLPVRSPMNPSFLDPNLVPQTLDSIYAHYRANRITIMQMYDENEDFLTSWTNKFGLARPQGLPVTPMPQYMNGDGQHARPITSIHYGYHQDQLYPHHDRLRLQEQGQDAPVIQVQASNNRLSHNQDLGPRSHAFREQEPIQAPSQVGRMSSLERSQAGADGLRELTIERLGTPQSNMSGHNPSEEPLTWRQEFVEQPYAPTRTASQGGQKTGSGGRSKPTGLINASQQAIRNSKKPAINAKNGFSVSADQAQRLIAMGVSDARSTRPGPVREASLPAATFNPPGTSSSATFSYPQYSNGVAGSSGSAIAGVQPGLVLGSQSRGNSPSPSVDSSDDPKDTTSNIRSRRTIAANNANGPSRKAAVAGNKRKSGKAESAPTLKRTRMNIAHMAKDSA